jgi:hypothetical protein
MERREMHEVYWLEIQKERDHCGDQDAGEWIKLELILEKCDGVVCTLLIWLSIGTSRMFL